MLHVSSMAFLHRRRLSHFLSRSRLRSLSDQAGRRCSRVPPPTSAQARWSYICWPDQPRATGSLPRPGDLIVSPARPVGHEIDHAPLELRPEHATSRHVGAADQIRQPCVSQRYIFCARSNSTGRLAAILVARGHKHERWQYLPGGTSANTLTRRLTRRAINNDHQAWPDMRWCRSDFCACPLWGDMLVARVSRSWSKPFGFGE